MKDIEFKSGDWIKVIRGFVTRSNELKKLHIKEGTYVKAGLLKKAQLDLRRMRGYIEVVDSVPEGANVLTVFDFEKEKEKEQVPQSNVPSSHFNYSGLLELRTFEDFVNLKVNRDFIVKDVLPPASLIMVVSPPACFKSLIALNLSMCVATGRSFLGLKVKKCNVLVSDKENSDMLNKERLMKIRKGLKVKSKRFGLFFLRRTDGDLDNSDFVESLKRTIVDKKIKLLILDTLHRHSDYNENEADDLNRLYTNVFCPILDMGVSIVFLHHTDKKGSGYRGSGDFLGMCDLVYQVNRFKNMNKFDIVNTKNRMGEIDDLGGEFFFDDDRIVLERSKQYSSDGDKYNTLKLLTSEVLGFFQDGSVLQQRDVEIRLEQEEFDYSKSTLKRVLKYLKDTGKLQKPDRKTGYSLVAWEEKVEDINHKCSVCGGSPCVAWDNGKPLCKNCK